ncbi:hypothetical protein SRABI91_02995 [Rhodococcoides fascians]|jgi:hypothetical protein|nr:hypothetical protein SRABI91_02995 [Rhodococcus fascians]
MVARWGWHRRERLTLLIATTKIERSRSRTLDLDLVHVAVTVNTEILPLRASDVAAASRSAEALNSRTHHSHDGSEYMARVCADREAIHNTPPPRRITFFAASVTDET